MLPSEGGRLAVAAIAAALAIYAAAAFSASVFWRARRLASIVRELEASLKASTEKAASERRGRTRAQQALRKALLEQQCPSEAQQASPPCPSSFPMAPIATVRSCFSTRNGTPRQPLLVPLARACLVLDAARAPPEAIEGLAEYSHCWVLYVFHLNTDLDKLWKEPSRSKFKAKVRVPRLQGDKKGVLATRSPHRPCPIGLTVAKVEAIKGRVVMLSGVDLVDGTPVIDIKPYLPYSDCVQEATVPKWLEADDHLAVASVSFSSKFLSSLVKCWEKVGKHSLYASPDEFQDLVRQALYWDIRSFSQKTRPHASLAKGHDDGVSFMYCDHASEDTDPDHCPSGCSSLSSSSSSDVTYHLVLEGIDVSYIIDKNSNVVVEEAALCSYVNTDRRKGLPVELEALSGDLISSV